MEKSLCPSMMCANYGNLNQEIKDLEEAGIDIFHVDVMDGQFDLILVWDSRILSFYVRRQKPPFPATLNRERTKVLQTPNIQGIDNLEVVAYLEEACGCGNKGCLENIDAGKYLVKFCKEVYKDTKIEDIFMLHGEDLQIKEFIDSVAVAVTTEINILNPDYIIVGGGVLNMKHFSKKELEE